MKKSVRVKRYFRKAREQHGTDLGDFYYSLAERESVFGVSGTCSDCPKRCKVHGVPGVSSFWCGDKIFLDKF
jgi:hypothetical protein